MTHRIDPWKTEPEKRPWKKHFQKRRWSQIPNRGNREERRRDNIEAVNEHISTDRNIRYHRRAS